MNSRMNIGGGISIPQEKEFQFMGSWIPVTPDKPMQRSNPIPVDRHGNQLGRGGWQELPRFSNGYVQDMSNYNRVVQNFNPIEQGGQNGGHYDFNGSLAERNRLINHIAGSYTQAFSNERAGWNSNTLANILAMKNAPSIATANRAPSIGIGMENRPLIPNWHSPVDNWRESNSANMLLADQFSFSGSNLMSNSDSLHQMPKYSNLLNNSESLHQISKYSNLLNNSDSLHQIPQSSNLLSNSDRLHQIPQYGFPIPYNLNLPPTEADAASSVTTTFQLTPVTPVEAKNLENNQLSAALNFSMDESSSQEKEKQAVTSTGNEAIQQDCDELLQNIVDSSSAVISTPIMEKRDSDGGSDRGIDLNKTPQQKTPKRRKHRPKVIVEGKSKRIPKPATPKNTASKDNPTGKRKYVRKKGLTEPATQQAEIMKEIIDASAETAAEACRRVLKFDSENNRDERHGEVAGQREEIQQWNERASHLNSESQGTELSTRTISGCRTNSTVKRKYIRKESPMRTQLVHKSVVSKENPTGKRKYVRKKGLKEPATQQEEIMREIMGPSAETGTESCRRVLNFDLESIRDERQGEVAGQWEEMQQWNERALNLNSESQGTEVCTRISSGCRTNSTVCISQQNGLSVENQQPGATGDLPSSMNQMPADYVSMPDRREAASLAPTQDLQVPNLNVISRNRDTRHADPCQKSSKNGYTLMQQHSHAEGIGQIVFQARSNSGKLDSARQLMCQSTPQSTPKILSNPNEARGSKREYCHAIEQIHSRTTNPTGSLLCQEIFQMDECDRNGGFPGAGCLESCKKKKIENGLHTNIYGLPCVAAVKDSSGQVKTKGTNEFTSQRNHILNFESGHVTNREKNGLNKSTGDWYIHSMASEHNFPKQHISSEPDSCLDRMRETNRLTQVHNFASQTTVENCNLFPPTPPKTAPAPRDGLVSKTCHTNVLEQKQTAEPTLSKSVSSKRGRVLQQQKEGMNDYQQSSARTRGRPLKPKNPFPIDEIIHKLNGLNLNGRNNQGEGQEQNAIVPYRRDGTVVPYQGEFIKKRKPRPKVDLDPETNRIWNLLMGKEGIEGIEGTDMGKEQWWENERKVFSGRADSFIARMHLVQGDRRFSKWKGSVVDSVIGVFLTQNVSDHLSSSAFMSLAARFPLKPIFNRTCNWDGTSILVEEPEVCDLNPNDTIEWHEKELSHPLFNRVITTTNKPMRQRRGGENTGIERASLVEAHCRSFDEEVLSSQDSYDSSIIQGNGGIRSCSGSNSEADDPITGCRPNKINGSTSPPQMENAATSFEEFFSRVNGCPLFHEGSKYGDKRLDNIETGQQKPRLDSIDNIRGSSTFTRPVNFNNPQMQVPVAPSSRYQLNTISHSEVLEVESFEMYGEECISSWPSTVSGFSKAKDVNCTGIGQLNGLLRSQEIQTMGPNELLSKHPMHQQSIAQPGCHNKNNQPYQHGCQHEKNNRTSVTEPVNLAEVLGKRQNSSMQHITDAPKVAEKTFDVERTAAVNKQMRLEDRLFEQNSREQVDSTGEAYNEKITNIPKAKKRKADSEKKNAIDWDSLREQVQANGRKKEWSKDTMDTMDYDAIRRANVKEISDSIKERGMNNMLAERIKEFLDRLVRDHGSIDLEWLRDVPPEKAKDYLLSIRGLGLKSVECVRLLTLHHLAFPVDTNVGRIAVRLGWVPLQPLPESLQLHLLELYPILESIQKYLWPRLCKLDQRTLYELHYQMITFGKVFCTKSKPNCNACPMRGECRHFASAFASARLVLPGPEEKSIVSSTTPMTAERSPAVVFSSMPLPSPENSLKEAGPAIGNSEPIVEEPATPEQEYKEITESDIEDYDDPNEIPTIKLNIQEFTENLQQYMQKNMELQEGDLSKALVALNPEAPSIPTPKLKNVSRLRTEHHVYELPDSHPLLKGMDRREPDDPSPYLLAIWTPGETANSIQPPEQRCGSLEPGKLCNEKTCFSCNSIREANSQTVRGTLLIPCRTAMRGSFPLNGTYFQVNEVFADDESSRNPIDVPRQWIWNLPRRVVYFGTSVSTIFKGLSTEGIQYCFWKGFVCVRGFDQKIRAPRPLQARLHFPASKLAKTKNDDKNEYKK